MDFDDNSLDDNFLEEETTEIGSDELLSEDDLRLPESANILVRLHAVKAWLTRRQDDMRTEIGNAALKLQELSRQESAPGARRRDIEMLTARQQKAQQLYLDTQQRLNTYEEAQSLLEECIDHTSGERVLVEYYLQLEDLAQEKQAQGAADNPTLIALADVLHRIEHVGAPSEED